MIYPSTLAAITIWANSVIVGRRFEDMRREVNSKFDSLDRRLDEMDRTMHLRLDDMDRRLDAVEKELDGMIKMISIVGKVDLSAFRQHELGVHYMAMTEKLLTDCSKRRG